MSKQLIDQYYNQVQALKRVGVKNEMAIKQPFDMLILQMAASKHYVYATEVTIKNENGKNIRPDGILMNELRIHKGYVESKDTDDSIDEEINKKLYKDCYPKSNILFQDSETAVLIQNAEEYMRISMKDTDKLDAIIKAFIDYKPAYVQKFEEALENFKEDIPTIVETLRELIEEQNETNDTYKKARNEFWEMCKQEINPEITIEDIREMVIQHILTEDLFKSIFDESDFHHENNIARELERLVNTFMNRSVRQNQLGELGHYYQTLNAQASTVADHHEKQKFLKVVYENFYKVYNPKGADRLGVVYTPNEIVDFMIRSTDHLLEKHFGRNLHDQNVHILDPATGTGTFITDIIEYIPGQYLKHKYENEIHANEVAILPYYVANLNIEFTYKQKMGVYAEFPNICFVDTLDNTASLSWDRMSKDQGVQTDIFGGVSNENAERIKKQNQQKISVVIGNPPYNANQANFNDFNKNREYPFIDKRIKETFVKKSTAQKTKVYDPYARFYRWAMDRIDQNGVICFVTNNSFINSRTFDGFRKCIQDDFEYSYIIDLGGNIRELSGKDGIFLGEAHTVFGLGAMVGVAIMLLVKKEKHKPESCRIHYIHPCDIRATRVEKFSWIQSIQNFGNIKFDQVTPDKKNNWINMIDNDWDDLIPILDKQEKNSLFSFSSLGVSTNRDEWVYDLDQKNLLNKSKYLSKTFNECIKTERIIESIKWSRDLRNKLKKKKLSKFSTSLITKSIYRPFKKISYYHEKLFSDMLTKNHSLMFGVKYNNENKIIIWASYERKPFSLIASNSLPNLNFFGDPANVISLYQYKEDGTRHDNITEWGLNQFQTHYSNKKITKEDIFHYTYGALHNPAYRKKYELNLKREFPRIPFYKDFHQWTKWGKELMDLHIGYEDVEPFDLKRIDSQPNIKGADQQKVFESGEVDPMFSAKGTLKVKLKAEKETGIIELDEQTSLTGVPPEAWEYKLGNRNAIEWVLDQYKEKKPKDKTIAEKFNTYRFSDYKEQVIELIKKVTAVSVETMKIIRKMEKIQP